MARTAPIPNIPAIPGMNPGVFIMGGGGDGGGGSGRGGGGGAGRQRAGGRNGGASANGGGRDARSCGPGSGGGCMNPAHGRGIGTHAGDPVDPTTGRVYTLPQVDMALLGPLALGIERAYSSFDADDRGLGYGWSHSLDWEIELRRQTFVLRRPHGAHERHALPAIGETSTLLDGTSLRRDSRGIVLAVEHLVYLFAPTPETASRYRLVAITDHARNRIELRYDAGRLARIIDSAGRVVTVQRFPDGHISRFEMRTSRGRTVWYRRYEYDGKGDLVAALDAEGRRIEMRYEEHRLVEQRYPSGLTAHFVYDQQGRCVETWCDYGGAPDPALAADVPELLANGVTPAKGMLHCRLEYGPDFVMVHDSRAGRRFDLSEDGRLERVAGKWVETLKRDAAGRILLYEDPVGSPTRFERDADGRVIALSEPDGARFEYRYDSKGILSATVDALALAVEYDRDEAGNLLAARDAVGMLLSCTYNARGLRTSAETPDGAVTRFTYDTEANLVEVIEPNGRARRIEYDDVGRIVRLFDEEGYQTRYHYDACGELCTVQLANGAAAWFDRDADGRLARYRSPDGAAYEFAWAGYDLVHELRFPTGEVVRFRYDREGQLVEVVGADGEVARYERDIAGRVVRERRFDGRTYEYVLDATGQLASYRNGAGERTSFERDPSGRVSRRTYADESFDAFEYDPNGRLARMDTEATVCEFVYDARGGLVRETQAHDRIRIVVESTYDAAGRRSSLRTSAGPAVRLERDAMGLVRRVVLDDGAMVARAFDGLGREILRELPDGGQLHCRYDGLGALLERHVVSNRASSVSGPAWTGPLAPGLLFTEGFVPSLSGSIHEHVDSSGLRTLYELDPMGRVVGLASSDGHREEYAFAPGGRLHERGPNARLRTYAEGGKILSCGDSNYLYDDEARRSERREGNRTRERYTYGARGLLCAIELEDGAHVENLYDASSRRLRKTVRRPDGSVRETIFIWSEDELIGEYTDEHRDGSRRRVVERWYVLDDSRGEPLLHIEMEGGDPATRRVVHYALGPGDFPTLLVGNDGAVLARLRPALWGRVARHERAAAWTPLRFLGQYEDEETGLFYNRHRFYDPDVGLYVSADPVGLAGGLHAFEYARGEPARNVDPLGLTPMRSVIQGAGITRQGLSQTGRTSPPRIHPIVEQAMPSSVVVNGETVYPAGARPPETCAEPVALSNYIREWERRNNGGRPLDPDNPRDAAQIRRCLRNIRSMRATDDGNSDELRAPCPNCSQLIQNLQARWGGPRSRAVQRGASRPNGGDRVRFTPPDPRWAAEMGL
ncbi:RHS repeat-associated core domain-containing protein [Sorangium sp. So ce296]|uniref:RHS repeat-associated core domain-containing protein n=1 Tax=Sorangium sp. So ce296 TaxID=3133296 RepID=UPI003F62DB5C